MDIRPMMKIDVEKLPDCSHLEVLGTLAICEHLLTISAFDLDHVHHLPHALHEENDTYCLPEGNQ